MQSSATSKPVPPPAVSPSGSILQRQSSILKKQEGTGTTATGKPGVTTGGTATTAAGRPGVTTGGTATTAAGRPGVTTGGTATTATGKPGVTTGGIGGAGAGRDASAYGTSSRPSGGLGQPNNSTGGYPNQGSTSTTSAGYGSGPYGLPNRGPGPVGNSMAGGAMGAAAPPQNGSMGASSFGPGGSFQRPGSMGSAYGMPSGMGGSFYGAGAGGSAYGSGAGGSMYGPGAGRSAYGSGAGGSMYGRGAGGSMYGSGAGGSMYGPGAGGSMYGPGAGGSMYGPGAGGSMYGPGAGGSMYGPGMGGSMYGLGMGGSMYGPGMGGSMYGLGMGGSMYGLGMGSSMYGPGMGGSTIGLGGHMGSMYGTGIGMAPQWGSMANMGHSSSQGSIYGSDVLHRSGSNYKIDLLFPNTSTLGSERLKRSGKRGGQVTSGKRGDKGTSAATGTSVSKLMVRKTSFSKSEDADSKAKTTTSTGANGVAKAKVPANYNIHSLVVLDKEGDASKNAVMSVKDPKTIVFKRPDGKDETFENDESLTRDKKTSSVSSVLLLDLQSNWLAGHTSGLLVAGGKDRGEETVSFAREFLMQSLGKVESEKKEKSITFDVTITMGAVESSDRILDLLDPDKSTYEKMQLGSSPVFGPCLRGMKTKTVTSAKDCGSAFDEAIKRSDNKKNLIVGFFVLKQMKKSTKENEVHLSSLCLGIAREEISHFIGLKEKSKSEPCTLFRYAVGGGSVTVSALLLSDRDAEGRRGLEMERMMREIKNSPPRSGNIKRCLEMTNKEITRQKEKMGKMGDTEKKSVERMLARMEIMVKDCEEMLSKPETTAPKGYAMG